MYEWMFVAPPAHKNSRYLGRSNTIQSTIGPPHAWSIPTNATTTTTFSCAAKELCFIWPFQAWFRFQLVSVSGEQSILRWILNGFPPPQSQSQSKSHLHALTLCGSIKNGQIEKNPPDYVPNRAPCSNLELAKPECTKLLPTMARQKRHLPILVAAPREKCVYQRFPQRNYRHWRTFLRTFHSEVLIFGILSV